MVLLLSAGCAKSIPESRYGVDTMRFIGVDEMDKRALRACLATARRDRVEINLGADAAPACGEPPFDARRLRIPLWRWWWTEWPVYDRNVFQRDLLRIERWYRARGYYDAQVTATEFDPPTAIENDHTTGDNGEDLCEREDDDEGCRLQLSITVEEGEPVLVESLSLTGDEELRPSVREALARAWELEVGERFDEALYDRSKQAMLATLREETFGCAEVRGTDADAERGPDGATELGVEIDTEARTARVALHVEAGPRSELGTIRVTGNEDLSEDVIRSVAGLEPGMPFTEALLDEAQHFVYSLGAFSTVDVIGTPQRIDGECIGTVDVEIQVTPGRRFRWGFGGGVLAGTYTAGTEAQDVRQWDVHLLSFVEHRNFLGGLRRIRAEARPKIIFQPDGGLPFRCADRNPRRCVGLDLRLQFRQPSFIESRTNLIADLRYDLGPDPNERFFRHVLDLPLSIQRTFLDGRISANTGIHFNLFRVPDGNATASDFELFFVEAGLTLDLRDDSRNPSKGFYLSSNVQVARRLSWDFVRTVPVDARVYAPLGGRVVAAARFRIGLMSIQRADDDLDAPSAILGPQLYRLRSGGASSHRGFLPGFLGDRRSDSGDPANPFRENSGGLRRWEASLELRTQVSEDFGLVVFGDMGDVNREESFRFDYIRLAIGGGLRYQTIVGPIRFDMGVRVPGAQIVGEDDPETDTRVRFLGLKLNGAFHITIGEAF